MPPRTRRLILLAALVLPLLALVAYDVWQVAHAGLTWSDVPWLVGAAVFAWAVLGRERRVSELERRADRLDTLVASLGWTVTRSNAASASMFETLRRTTGDGPARDAASRGPRP